jgi:diguanylate cyclase (GGDEF)-like protein
MRLIVRQRPDARTDALTGVGNRLAWDEALQLHQHDLRAAGKPHSIVRVEVDSVELVQAVADTLRDVVRGDDVVARVGGGEFAILMRDTDEGACVTRVDRLRQALSERGLAATLEHTSVPPVS